MENKRPQHKWTKEEIEYLKEITPGHHHKEILDLMNEKFEYQFGLKQVAGAIKRYNLKTGFTGHFKKGSEPWNKGTKGLTGPNRTSFKKGETTQPNYRCVGSERINRDGYVEVKIKDPATWELKHRVVWEKHYGKVPKDHNVIFLDKNRNNFNIDNLACISRQELLMLNRHRLNSENAEITRMGISLAKLMSKSSEVKKKVKNE